MATDSKARTGMTLEEFLKWSRIDEKPYLEFLDGRIEVKVSPQRKHSVIDRNLTNALYQFAYSRGLGAPFPELRCTFAGRSMVPDIVFHLEANIQVDEAGEVVNECMIPPDIHIEIRSPDQSVKKTRQKLEHSVAHGSPLGWFIDPERRTIDVYRPGLPPERLAADGYLDAAPVLPGFRIAVSEVFGWLKHRTEKPADAEADPR